MSSIRPSSSRPLKPSSKLSSSSSGTAMSAPAPASRQGSTLGGSVTTFGLNEPGRVPWAKLRYQVCEPLGLNSRIARGVVLVNVPVRVTPRSTPSVTLSSWRRPSRLKIQRSVMSYASAAKMPVVSTALVEIPVPLDQVPRSRAAVADRASMSL